MVQFCHCGKQKLTADVLRKEMLVSMGKEYRIYQIDSFTKERLSGNPAGVVTNAEGLTEPLMRKIARELNNSETAFIFPASDDTHDVHVRFFTPLKEVPICGHATIAAHYARAMENGLKTGRVLQKTGVGILPVDILRTGDDYKIIMTQGEISIGGPLDQRYRKRLLEALRITEQDVRDDCPVAIVSTGHSKVMVGINDLELLHGLRPNLTELSDLSGLIGCSGYYVFTLHPGETPLVHGRMFAPAIGINEDPVTGNANGPLGAYLVHFGWADAKGDEFSFEAVQGEAIGRTGRMQVQVKVANGEPSEVRIIGDAVIAFFAKMELDTVITAQGT